MDRPAEPISLEAEEEQQLRDLTTRLEKAWNEGSTSVDLEQFVPGAGEALRQPALKALVKADLEIRWRRGQRVFVERYFERFPELRAGGKPALQLVCEEYRIRLFDPLFELPYLRRHFHYQIVVEQRKT